MPYLSPLAPLAEPFSEGLIPMLSGKLRVSPVFGTHAAIPRKHGAVLSGFTMRDPATQGPSLLWQDWHVDCRLILSVSRVVRSRQTQLSRVYLHQLPLSRQPYRNLQPFAMSKPRQFAAQPEHCQPEHPLTC